MTDTIDFEEMNRKVIAEFRATGGKAGGMFEGKPLVLVHNVGARTGARRVTPLIPLVIDDRIFVFATKGGSDEHPAWYHNLVANPEATVELGTETFPVVARVLTGSERDEIYAKQAVAQPQFADYERGTSRVIPVIELRRS